MKSNDAIARAGDFDKRPSEQFPTLGLHFDPDDDHRAGGVGEQHRRDEEGGNGGFRAREKA